MLMMVAIAREPGPTPTDVALAYEMAWDRLDFVTVWNLSGSELRDGLDADAFVSAKRAAYERRRDLRGLLRDALIESVVLDGEAALVRTRLLAKDGTSSYHDVTLTSRDGSWRVVAYTLQVPEPMPDRLS